MAGITLRAMGREDWSEVADLIYASTNGWYEANGKAAIFGGDPNDVQVFCSVYEALDPGCCVLAVDDETGRIAGSCFFHPRPTHVSLGIMNVHPAHFGRGVARRLLRFIADLADGKNLPVRLVSSAMNLDSFSLYTRAGFVPRTAYQDMVLDGPLPADLGAPLPERARVRDAKPNDAPAMAALERELNHIDRGQDYAYFLENAEGIWHASVLVNEAGGLDGFLVSVAHPASNMLGPGVARTQGQAAALIAMELKRHPAKPVFLVPVECAELVQTLYGWGARNCELHFAQVRGAWRAPAGVVLPTFLPETG